MDNRAAITILIGAVAHMKEKKIRPTGDIYLAMTTNEEIGGHGAAFAARTLPGDRALAVDSGPASEEYGVALTDAPVVAYGDAKGLYDKSIADQLLAHGRRLGMEPQCAYWQSYGSDASMAKALGQTPKAGLLCVPTENTHGYEIIPRKALSSCVALLAAYLENPD